MAAVSAALASAVAASKVFVGQVEVFIRPMDPILVSIALFLVCFAIGLTTGHKKGVKDFFKYPSIHWRARGR